MSEAVGNLFIFIFALPIAVAGAMLAWMLVFNILKATCWGVYYAVYYAWSFVVLPAFLCFVVVIGSPFYVIFVLAPWCLRRLFGTTRAADDPLW